MESEKEKADILKDVMESEKEKADILKDVMESEKEKADILKDEDVTAFIRKNKATNTITKTASDMRIWKRWCESVGERRNVEDIPSTELDSLLSHFFVKVCKKNGEEYEPLSLISYQRSIDRYLREEKRQTRSILKDPEFKGSRAALTAKRNDLRRQGMGRKPNAAQPLTKAEEDVLWEIGQLGEHSPASLTRTI